MAGRGSGRGKGKRGRKPPRPIERAARGARTAEARKRLPARGPSRDAEAEAPGVVPEPGKFLVVGVGASAGGLEALGELTQNVPIDHMAFIIVQHLAPQHESVLPQLLARTSKVKVVTASDGITIEPNNVYVLPPNADLAVMHGVIHLIKPAGSSGPRLPIDYTFRTLAEDQGASAIGIVLSGTGSDGTFGLEAIKAAGGITFVQDPASARYDGMPRSALASGAADFCLTPQQIGEELARIAKLPRVLRAAKEPAPGPHAQDQLGKLFLFIRSAFGNDLSSYKSATIDRRIERRMTLHKIARLEDYVSFVQSNQEELRALYKDMLITVTSFFRDPEVFEALKAKVIPELLAQRGQAAAFRVWVPACATGEEAYSFAICLLEFLADKGADTRVQIFGTDVDDDAIQHARRGVYPANIELDVSPDRLNRFFTKKDHEYTVSRRIRDMVVFSKQNILKDAPFSRIDLASCRNLLIYLQPASQKKVLRILHYALNPGGHLVLGTSESVGDAPDLFSLLDRKTKIYTKKNVAPQVGLESSFGTSPRGEPPQQPSAAPKPKLSLQTLVDRRVIELYGPPGVVVNEDLEIVQFRGHTGPFLDPVPGTATLNLLKLARFDLHIELKKALEKARSQYQRVTTEIRYLGDDKGSDLRLDVSPIQDPESNARCFVVLFDLLPPPRGGPAVSRATGGAGDATRVLRRRIEQLDRELALTKEFLQTTIEEKESTTEELKSANEELQSSNEELQSTNEELETSKEEMQSTNEELTTVNEELQNRMAELSQINDDLHNVLAGVDNAVIIVGMDLRIRRFTVAAEKIFNLVPADIGRSVDFLDPFLGAGALGPKVSSVVESLNVIEEEILARDQRWYLLRVSPYKTLDHAIRGALIVLVQIDVRKRAAAVTRDAGEYATRFLAAVMRPLVMVDRRLRIVWANEPFLSTFQLSAEETVGSLLPSLGANDWLDTELRRLLAAAFASGTLFRDHPAVIELQGVGRRQLRVGGSQIPVSSDVPLVLISMEPLP
jgi:two-component system, chemotaxis family, CheB/CheR fusion protein